MRVGWLSPGPNPEAAVGLSTHQEAKGRTRNYQGPRDFLWGHGLKLKILKFMSTLETKHLQVLPPLDLGSWLDHGGRRWCVIPIGSGPKAGEIYSYKSSLQPYKAVIIFILQWQAEAQSQ